MRLVEAIGSVDPNLASKLLDVLITVFEQSFLKFGTGVKVRSEFVSEN